MTDGSVCLTLIAARSLRDELFDYLTERRDLVWGFTASEADGHGPNVELQTAAEQVKGHADQMLVRMILTQADAAQLLADMRTAFAGSRLTYWIMPVTEFGLIDDRAQSAAQATARRETFGGLNRWFPSESQGGSHE
ncbi:DUF3240 family protein [Bradyrhizobium cenepequi]